MPVSQGSCLQPVLSTVAAFKGGMSAGLHSLICSAGREEFKSRYVSIKTSTFISRPPNKTPQRLCKSFNLLLLRGSHLLPFLQFAVCGESPHKPLGCSLCRVPKSPRGTTLPYASPLLQQTGTEKTHIELIRTSVRHILTADFGRGRCLPLTSAGFFPLGMGRKCT